MWDPDVFDSPDIAAFRVEAAFTEVPAFLPRALATETGRGASPSVPSGFPGELAYPETVLSETLRQRTALVVQHNLDLSGGTSGSAIFDHKRIHRSGELRRMETVIGAPDERPRRGNRDPLLYGR